MTRLSFVFRSLQHYWRSHVAVGLGVMVATATLTGALLVGDSMRGSLHDLAVGRLGNVDQTLVSSSFFREALAAELTEESRSWKPSLTINSAILARASITHADSAARVSSINALGVNEQFWKLSGDAAITPPTDFTGRTVILNEPLALELRARQGDDILLRLGKPSQVSTKTLLGRRDDTSVTLRLKVVDIVPANDIGGFSLSPKQSLARNAFVPLKTMQRAFDQAERVSALLVARRESRNRPIDEASLSDRLDASIRKHLTIEDIGLSLRMDQTRGYMALETRAILLDPGVERIALETAHQLAVPVARVLTYLANEIKRWPGDSTSSPSLLNQPAHDGIPYSTISATSLRWTGVNDLTLSNDDQGTALKPGEIVLNGWAADDLHVKAGDRIEVSYFVTEAGGTLHTEKASFTLRGIATMNTGTLDSGFTPTYKGITDTHSLSQWHAPFPIDLRKVRDKDDAYWEEHHAAPKAFISLEDGRHLWAEKGQRLGGATSIRFYPAADQSLEDLRRLLATSLRKNLDPKDFNLSFDPIRQNLTDASQGSTDFGELFIGFSFFLIGSGAMLIALLYRLGIERRATDIGTLLAAGWSATMVNRTIILEGAVVATIGSLLGLAAAIGYAQLMLLGLRSWWVDAVNTPFLTLYVSPFTLLIGFVASFSIAVGSMAWSMRGLARLSPTALVGGLVQAGVSRDPKKTTRRAQVVTWLGIGSATGLALASWLSDAVPQAAGFFGTGAAMLVGCLGAFAWLLGSSQRSAVAIHTRNALARLGAANCVRNPGRSLLTAGLIASATFLIVALEAFRLEPDADMTSKNTGAGGFELLAESTAPLAYDLNTPQGRQALGFDDQVNSSLGGIDIFPLRLRPGDESSCLNLYHPTTPRIVGASDALIARGGFRFSSTLAESEQQLQNPWTLLDKSFEDGAVPVIGDEAAVLWQLHSGLGQDLIIKDHRGHDITVRFVALLTGSVLQDELVVAQSHFVDMFPDLEGSTFFLIDTGQQVPSQVQRDLERELSVFGFDASSTHQRLQQYLAVQNTYLGTFQMLGGLGLILGTVGLAVVLLRNTWERRSELALLQALGFTGRDIRTIVFAENALLVGVGLIAGTVPAVIAIAPAITQRASTLPWGSVMVVLLGVVLVGLGFVALVMQSALKVALIPALRTE